jgi:HAMP domain-containing protein
MKKVLVGVGIGCGVLVLLGIIGVGVAGFWAKRTLGGVVEAGQQMQAQQQEMAQLNQSYPFTPPPEGEVLVLQEARLNDYFAIREATLPLFKQFEEKSKGLQQNQEANVSDAIQATSLLAEFMTKTRGAYIENLKKHSMSPKEFMSISVAIYSSFMADSVGQLNKAMAGQRESIEKAREELETKLSDESLSGDERDMLEQQRDALQAQLDAMDENGAAGMPHVDERGQEVASVNVKLLEKFKARIEQAYNPAFDALLMSEDAQNAFGNLAQPQQ